MRFRLHTQTDGHTDRRTHRQTDRQTDRRTDTHAHAHTTVFRDWRRGIFFCVEDFPTVEERVGGLETIEGRRLLSRVRNGEIERG